MYINHNYIIINEYSATYSSPSFKELQVCTYDTGVRKVFHGLVELSGQGKLIVANCSQKSHFTIGTNLFLVNEYPIISLSLSFGFRKCCTSTEGIWPIVSCRITMRGLKVAVTQE